MKQTTGALVTICVLALISGRAAAQTQAILPDIPNEISVSAEAFSWAPPDRARIILLIEDSNESAEAAEKALAEKQNAVQAALKSKSPELQLLTSGGSLGPAGGAKSMNALGSTPGYRVVRELTFETDKLNHVGALVDAATKAGPARLKDVSYLVRDDHKQREVAYQQAAARAKSEAQVLAQALGLKLGAVTGITVTEEPEGILVRENASMGLEPLKSGDRELRIYVNLRAELIK